MKETILKAAGANGPLDAIRVRLQKAETSDMSLQDLVAFFDDVFRVLKEHALRKHFERSTEKISGEQAFSRLHMSDSQFRDVVTKARQAQNEFADSI